LCPIGADLAAERMQNQIKKMILTNQESFSLFLINCINLYSKSGGKRFVFEPVSICHFGQGGMMKCVNGVFD
jgi:hypothetical protein